MKRRDFLAGVTGVSATVLAGCTQGSIQSGDLSIEKHDLEARDDYVIATVDVELTGNNETVLVKGMFDFESGGTFVGPFEEEKPNFPRIELGERVGLPTSGTITYMYRPCIDPEDIDGYSIKTEAAVLFDGEKTRTKFRCKE